MAQQHLVACGECAKAYTALGSDLAEMKFTEPPARDAAYGHRVWESLASSLPVLDFSAEAACEPGLPARDRPR